MIPNRPGLMRGRTIAIVASLFVTIACSDAATRLAYDIESGVDKLGQSDGARASIAHGPRSWPEGCSGAYSLRIEKGGATSLGQNNFRIKDGSGGLSVRCAGQGSGGWGTTYHLRFVDVPVTVEVSKNDGEAATIELQRVAGRAVLVGLH
jgi:hypothetical protein